MFEYFSNLNGNKFIKLHRPLKTVCEIERTRPRQGKSEIVSTRFYLSEVEAAGRAFNQIMFD